MAARAADATLTGHVTGTALSGTARVTAVADQTVARDVLLTGAVTTASVTPADGATLVERTAQIEIAASAALDPASVTNALITLLSNPESPSPNPVSLRPVLSGSGQVLAVVPDVVLDPATPYRLRVSGLRDVYGAAVSVAAVTFTTRTDAPATYDPRKVVVSMPDANGIAHVTAAAGSVAPGTQVVVINEGQGSVASFQADNDGALNGEVAATVEDRLLVTITDPSGASTSFERGAYVAPDQQSVAINGGGGRVTEPGQAGFAAGAQLVLPPETVVSAMLFHLQNFDKQLLRPDDPLPDLPDGVVGATVQITSPVATPFKKEAKLVFERPAGAPDDAAYLIYKRVDLGAGRIVWAVLDQASLDPATGQVTTHSPPYPGVDGSGDLFATLMYTAGPHSLRRHHRRRPSRAARRRIHRADVCAGGRRDGLGRRPRRAAALCLAVRRNNCVQSGERDVCAARQALPGRADRRVGGDRRPDRPGDRVRSEPAGLHGADVRKEIVFRSI